jgi:hypothetical protein
MRAARATRYLAILWLGARYGLAPLTGLRRKDTSEIGVALRDALQAAGGILVKFGQMLSARSDLVPATIALELSSLQDDGEASLGGGRWRGHRSRVGRIAGRALRRVRRDAARSRVDRAGASRACAAASRS